MSQRFVENTADDAVHVRSDPSTRGAIGPIDGIGEPLPRFIRAPGIHRDTITLCYSPSDRYFFYSGSEQIWMTGENGCLYTGTYRRLNSFFEDEKYRDIFRAVTCDDAVDISRWYQGRQHWKVDYPSDPKSVWRWEGWLNAPRVEIHRLNLFLAAIGEALIDVDSVSPSEVRKTIKEYEKRYPQYRACG